MKRELLVIKRFVTHIKRVVFFPTDMLLSFLFAIMIIVLPTPAFCDVAGYFSNILNVVELTKRGNPPAIQAKVQDKVEVMDAIRTGSSGKAAIKFIDESSLIISPGSQVIIDKYLFDQNKSYRKAELSFFKGLFHVMVKYYIQADKPDFIINTYTAVLGQRGTAWYTISESNFTDIFCEHGKLSIESKRPRDQSAINGYQATRVWKDQKPLHPLPITSEDLTFLKKLLDSGLPLRYEPGNNPIEFLGNLKSQSSNKVPPPATGLPTPLQTAPFRSFEPKPPVTPHPAHKW
jgi:hypothetical protein